MNLFPNDEIHEEFGCNELPTLRISLMDNNEIKYVIIIDSLSYYHYYFNNGESYLKIDANLINDVDYAVLVSKKYDKYLVETRNYWRNATTGKDTVIENPAQIYHNISITYEINSNSDPTKWEFVFDNYKR